MYRLSDAPGIYPQLVELPAAAVIVHFPFGLPEREIQYGYYAMLHRRRILNGYSGVFPITYSARLAVLHDPTADQARTQTILEVDRVTHAVVHTKAYADGRGEAIVRVLERLGWQQVMTIDGDYLLEK